MLVFEDKFFEQEVREGFYIDHTMKTLWAAELEALNDVAQVCKKYNLQWYAAFGTLLGTIRHEGYIPWDDDLDILMRRKDYMKLMEVLPKELPDNYHVRSPLTEEGYTNFHCCVNTGTGVSISKEWLEKYHGCPFTVGVDIFPMDKLPRNKGERELQKNLFTLAGRCAQLTRVLANMDIEKAESDRQKTYQDFYTELIEGMKALEASCNYNFQRNLLEEEKWAELESDFWKLANYLAMMHNQEDSDYLVMYGDYISNEKKVYPKEWFRESYMANFEVLMIPVMNGYDDFLKLIYGDYMKRVHAKGMHEYPYYKRQLVELRKYVKNAEKTMQQAGLLAMEEVVVKDTADLMKQWEGIRTKADGTPKKRVLFTNDLDAYRKYGEFALDTLEQVLNEYKEKKDEIAFWWRPQPKLERAVQQLSEEWGKRYAKLKEAYLQDGWGLYDDTEDMELAVENCDVYYGDPSEIVQSIQSKQIPCRFIHYENELPEAWEAALYNEQGEKRKVMLFQDSVEMVAQYGEKAIEKLQAVMDLFLQNKEKFILWWRPQNQLEERIAMLPEEVADAYVSLVNRYVEEDWGIFDMTENRDRATDWCDAYYGCWSELVLPVKDLEKPCMIMAWDVV